MRPLVLLLFLTAGCASAGEYAVLSGGSRLHADRHEISGDKVRLYTGSGYIELEAARIQAFEADAKAPPVPTAATNVGAPPQPASPSQLADAAADRYGLPRELVRSVIAAESGFQTQAVSPRGCRIDAADAFDCSVVGR